MKSNALDGRGAFEEKEFGGGREEWPGRFGMPRPLVILINGQYIH